MTLLISAIGIFAVRQYSPTQKPERIDVAQPSITEVEKIAESGRRRDEVLPADVGYELVPFPYVLNIQNLTDTEITILPSDFGASRWFQPQRLQPQKNFQIVLSFRRLRVGDEGTGIMAKEVIPGPYIDVSEEVEAALIETEHGDGDEYRIRISLRSEDWLKPFSTGPSSNASPTLEPLVLPIAITNFDKEYWYREGPTGPP